MFSYIFSIFKKKDDEVESLNGLRALAILLVIAFHLWTVFKNLYLNSWTVLATAFDNFNSGVDLFFILSGYLIYGGLLKRFEKSGTLDIRNFFLNRALRILPAFYFALFIIYSYSKKQVVAMAAHPPSDPGLVLFWQAQARTLDYVWSDIFFVSNYFPRVMIVDWSLSVENHFYLILPFVCSLGLLKLKSEHRILILGILYILPGLSRLYGASVSLPYTLVHETHNRLDSIIIGMIIAEVIVSKNTSLSLVRSRILSLAAILLLGIGHSFPINSLVGKSLSLNMQNIGYGLLTFLCLNANTVWNKIFSWSVFRPIARISYSMYLWNIVGLGAGAGLVAKNRDNLSPFTIFKIVVISSLVTFLVSWILYLAVEKPFVDWKNKIAKSKA